MANQRKKTSRGKKKKTMNPTVKAGILVLIVLGLIWGVTVNSEPWYQKIEETEPISMAEEVPTATKAPVTTPAAEPVTETSETAETTTTTTTTVAETVKLPMPDIMTDNFDYGMDLNQFSREKHNWTFKRNTDHSPVVGYNQGVDLAYYDAFYIVPTDQKVVYLTFDEGYENGYTARILDTLRDNDVQASFFVTAPYVDKEYELVKRMKDEGHIVGNHSVHHYDGSSGDGTALTEVAPGVLVTELTGVADLMKEKTGYSMDMFFRPPAGLFSDQTLYVTRQQGYKTVFWSMAYQDWYVDNQPGAKAAYDHVIGNVHPGAIILLHAVSESNTEALDSIIKELKAQGYRFGSLYELPSRYID